MADNPQMQGQPPCKNKTKASTGKIVGLSCLGCLVFVLLLGILVFCFWYFWIRDGSAFGEDEAPIVDSVMAVEVVEEPVTFEEPEVITDSIMGPATEWRNYTLNGDIDGTYPITMRLQADVNDEGQLMYVKGKYAYKTTLQNYGSGESSWFYFEGEPNYDGEITCRETTPSNSNYANTLTFTFNGYQFDGVSEGTDATTHTVLATVTDGQP